MNRKLLSIIITGLVIEILCISIASLGDIKENIPMFCFLYTASFIVYIFAVFYILKNTEIFGKDKSNSKKILWTIIIFSLIFRLTLLPMTPSEDVYRYLWEGKLQLNWLNPYSYPPESSSLEHLRDNFFSGINHKHLTTIYPPLTLMAFALADYVSHSFISMKSTFLFFDVLSIFILIRFLRVVGGKPANVLIYAWSPLVLISFAAKGHCDSLQIFLVILALYLFSIRKNLKSIVSIGLAAMSKFVFIIIAPFLIPRRKLKYLIVLFTVIALLYLPYIGAGKGLFSTLLHFGTQYHYNDSAHFLIFCLCLGSPFMSKIITSIIFCAVLLYLYINHMTLLFTKDNENSPNSCFSRHKGGTNPPLSPPQLSCTVSALCESKKQGGFREIDDNILKFAFLSVGTFLIFAPTVHPWYLTWIVPFLCFYHSWAWLVLTGTVVFYYFMNHNLFSSMIEYNNEWVWQEVHWLKLPEYVPFYCLLIYGWLRSGSAAKARQNDVSAVS
ncbi:MAG: hypothetical protein ACE5KZ_00550 [Candidatus Scalinduaceae bacterium]